MIKAARYALVVPIVVVCFSLPIRAHAILLKSTPTTNQTVDGGTIPIELRFNSRIDGKRSRLTILSANGTQTVLIQQRSSDVLTSEVANLSPGPYVLHWQVLSQDGHAAQGDVPFRVQ